MPNNQSDIDVLRDLATQYAEIAAKPIQNERRRLWSDHFSLKPTRPLVLATFGMWNVWCRDVFGDDKLKCTDPFYREHERTLRMAIFQDSINDDFIIEPWFTLRAAVKVTWRQLWGVTEAYHAPDTSDGAGIFDPPIKTWDDMSKLKMTQHEVDETKTQHDLARLNDAIGHILPIDVQRKPIYSHFSSDISSHFARLRGLEQIMIDMYDSPNELHQLLAFMRDSILENNAQAEQAGHYTLTSQTNQTMTYADNLAPPSPNSDPVKRKDLWGFCAAQEYTLISPQFHDEFLIQYQLPIYNHFGLLHYGCCEDLTTKIDVLRQFKTLRSISIGPTADIEKGANQIAADYVISWRPNPTDMVSYGFDEDRIRSIVTHALDVTQGSTLHILLKDIETVQDDPSRLARWTQITRDIIDHY